MAIRIHYLFNTLLVTSLCLLSCEKTDVYNDSDTSETINWWYRADLVSRGIKTIVEGDDVYQYDRNGHLTQYEYPGYKISYKYNSQGLISRKTILDTKKDDEVTTTVTYEYENVGKYVPNVTVADLVTQLNSRSLLPNLSKIKVEKTNRTFITEFKFNGDTLVITDNSLDNYYDTIYVLYKDNYPYSTTSGSVGPITYQKNGMFKTLRIGSQAFFYKEDDRYLLLEQYLVHANDFFNYTYDESGNVVKIERIQIDYDNKYVETTEISYKYDERGNWIERTTTQNSNITTETRKISYWTH